MSINWKKTTLILLDILIGVYLVLAVTAFNKPDVKATVCSEVKINLAKDILEGFLTPDEVKQLLQKKQLYPIAKPMKEINTRAIEEYLKASPYIETAECYKTQSGHICIDIHQRMPVMRVLADNGDNYYLDNNGNILPGDLRYANNTVVATGTISRSYAKKSLTELGNIIAADPFWQSQIVQINVTHDGVEMIPRVGNHVIWIGKPVDINRKLDRLRKFYKYGLSHAGWNKYERISVEFDNQIVCKKVRNKR